MWYVASFGCMCAWQRRSDACVRVCVGCMCLCECLSCRSAAGVQFCVIAIRACVHECLCCLSLGCSCVRRWHVCILCACVHACVRSCISAWMCNAIRNHVCMCTFVACACVYVCVVVKAQVRTCVSAAFLHVWVGCVGICACMSCCSCDRDHVCDGCMCVYLHVCMSVRLSFRICLCICSVYMQVGMCDSDSCACMHAWLFRRWSHVCAHVHRWNWYMCGWNPARMHVCVCVCWLHAHVCICACLSCRAGDCPCVSLAFVHFVHLHMCCL